MVANCLPCQTVSGATSRHVIVDDGALADAAPMVVLAAGFDSVTVKPSSGSTTVSPATLTVIVCGPRV
jgi:hypothetical protein